MRVRTFFLRFMYADVVFVIKKDGWASLPSCSCWSTWESCSLTAGSLLWVRTYHQDWVLICVKHMFRWKLSNGPKCTKVELNDRCLRANPADFYNPLWLKSPQPSAFIAPSFRHCACLVAMQVYFPSWLRRFLFIVFGIWTLAAEIHPGRWECLLTAQTQDLTHPQEVSPESSLRQKKKKKTRVQWTQTRISRIKQKWHCIGASKSQYETSLSSYGPLS